MNLVNLYAKKQYSKSVSNSLVKELWKGRKSLTSQDFLKGNIIFTRYNAKDKEQVFDKTPLFMVLKKSRNYTLGLNFNWIPYKKRLILIQHILDKNQTRIKQGKRVSFTYLMLKQFLKKIGLYPCIRLYINKRIYKQGVVIQPSEMLRTARLRTESFTQNKYSAQQIYNSILRKK